MVISMWKKISSVGEMVYLINGAGINGYLSGRQWKSASNLGICWEIMEIHSRCTKDLTVIDKIIKIRQEIL